MSADVESPWEPAVRNGALGDALEGKLQPGMARKGRPNCATSWLLTGLNWEQPWLAYPVSKHLRFYELEKKINLRDVLTAAVHHRTQHRYSALLAAHHRSHTVSTCGVTAVNASASVALCHQWTATPRQQLTPPRYKAAQCLNEQRSRQLKQRARCSWDS